MAVTVPSRTDRAQAYTVENGRCSCPGFTYRKTCWHVRAAADVEAREEALGRSVRAALKGNEMTQEKDLRGRLEEPAPLRPVQEDGFKDEGLPAPYDGSFDPADLVNVEQAIAWIYTQVGYVRKQFKPQLGYSYASEAEVIAALRPAMVEAGVTVRVVGIADVEREVVPTTKGTPMNRTTLQATVRFTHAASGTCTDVVALGEGMDIGDKSSTKAQTVALKYALRQTFALETGDDPDQFTSREQERAPERPAQSRGKQQPPKQDKQPAPAPTVYAWEEELRKALHEAGLAGASLAAVFDGETPTKERINEYLSTEEKTVKGLVSAAADRLAARQEILK